MNRKLKKKLWTVFSKYIRLRDSIKYNNSTTEGKCVTCGLVYPISKLQAGHYIPGRNNAVLFDEEQVHSQCYQCNVSKHGNWVAYRKFMLKEYGKKKVEQIENSHQGVVKLTDQWGEEKYKEYTNKIKDLECKFREC